MNGTMAVLCYNELPDIHEIDELTTKEGDCLKEIRDVLIKYGCADRLGVTLLHNHFHLIEGEVLVESCDVENRVLVARPRKVADLDFGSVIETNWRFIATSEDAQARMHCVAVCVNDGAGQHIGQDHRQI